MAMADNIVKYPFDKPGKYSIQVEGFVDASRSEMLAGMRITNHMRENRRHVSELIGTLRDQAALAGVLNTLYEMHLTLLSVQYLGSE
jgi:hypothetical protein